MVTETSVDRELPALYSGDARASAPAGATLLCADDYRLGTPPAFMPPSMTSSLPVT
jgi:hypothetical protein